MVDTIGWVAAALGACITLPQLFRLLRTDSVAGVAQSTWQLSLGANLAWASHGFVVGHVNMWLPNVVLLIWTVLILRMFRRHREVTWWQLVWPGLGLATVTTLIDVFAGPVAFAAVAAVPAVVSMVAQLLALVRSPELTGVSALFYVINFTNQLLWITWAAITGEQAVLIVGTVVAVLWIVNITWLALRRTRLVGPLWPSAV